MPGSTTDNLGLLSGNDGGSQELPLETCELGNLNTLEAGSDFTLSHIYIDSHASCSCSHISFGQDPMLNNAGHDCRHEVAWPSMYMGGCQNYGPFLGPLNTRCRIKLRTQKGTILFTTTHIHSGNSVMNDAT